VPRRPRAHRAALLHQLRRPGLQPVRRGVLGGGGRPLSDHVRWSRRPDLRSPVVLAAFSGWNDAGDAATSALATLGQEWGAEPFADIDPEEFFDFTANRPNVRLV